MFEDAEIIDRYTRAEAIEDGTLVDVSETAKEAGITAPVAVTVGLYAKHIRPTEIEKSFGQSENGRLWDLLWMFRVFARQAKGPVMHYQMIVAKEMKTAKDRLKQQYVTIKAVIGPGDNGEPVITLMLPNED